MGSQYQDIGELIRWHGLREAFAHSMLELSDKFPSANRLLSGFVRKNAFLTLSDKKEDCSREVCISCYAKSYIAHWDKLGRLVYVNPNPDYPRDLMPFDPITHQPQSKSEDYGLVKTQLKDFARAVSKMNLAP